MSLRCKITGHDWFYRRMMGVRQCLRCFKSEEYEVEETHTDEEAEKGQKRFKIEDGRLITEQYKVTAWGDDTEYWQWAGSGSIVVTEDNLQEIREEIDEYLENEE